MGKLALFVSAVAAAVVLLFCPAVFAAAPDAPVLSGIPGATWVVLNWPDVTGATSYTVSRDGSVVYTGTNDVFADTGLTSGTAYSYTVVATNVDGDSGPSNTVILTPNPASGITTRDINLIGFGIALVVAFYTIRSFRFRGDV